MGIFDIFKKSTTETKAQENPLMASLVSAGFDIDGLEIENNEGVVTIAGQIENGSFVNNISNFLQRTPGVQKVINKLEVKDLTDQGLQYEVQTKVRFLNVRKGPNTDYEIIGKFENKEKVLLIKKTTDNWYLVKGQKVEGYCCTDFLKPV